MEGFFLHGKIHPNFGIYMGAQGFGHPCKPYFSTPLKIPSFGCENTFLKRWADSTPQEDSFKTTFNTLQPSGPYSIKMMPILSKPHSPKRIKPFSVNNANPIMHEKKLSNNNFNCFFIVFKMIDFMHCRLTFGPWYLNYMVTQK